MNSCGYIARREGSSSITDPEGDSCFRIYQISWIKMKIVTICKLKTSFRRNFVYNFQVQFYDFVANSACTTASFIAQISSFENVLKRDAILASLAKR